MDEKLLELGYTLITEPLISREGIEYSTVGRLISPDGDIIFEREDFDRIDEGAAIATARRHAVEAGLVDVRQCRLTSRYGEPCPGCGYHTSVVAEDSDGMTWRACPWLRASAEALGARLTVIRRQYGLVWPEDEAGPPADGHPTIASLFARRQKDEP